MSEEVFVRKATGLVREFSPFFVFALVYAFTLGIHVNYFSVNNFYTYPGADVFFAYALSGLVILPSGFALWLMSSAMPRSGGPYIYISRIFNPAFGYICGLSYYLYIVATAGTVAALTISMLQSGLAVIGAIFRNSMLMGIATELSRNTWWWFIGGLLSLAINLLIVSASRRLGRIWLYIMVTLPLIGGLITIIVLLAANPATSASLWDSAFGSGAYKEIVNSAISAGWKSSLLDLNPQMTATVVPVCILAWTGAGIVGTFIAGETKRPTLSMFVGTVGAGLFVFIYQLIYVGGILNAYGLEWISQVNYAMAKGTLTINPKLSLSVPLMAAVLAYGIPPIAFYVGINGFLMTLKSPVSFYYSGSRLLFAMAFDRMMPAKLSELHPKTGTPVWNYIFTFILSTIFCYITTPASGLGPYIALWVGFTLAGWMFIFACLAAAIFPFVRRDVYEVAGKPVTWKIFGVPVISIMGIVGFIGWMYAFINNAYTLVVRGGWFGALIPPLELAIMLVVFLAFAAYNAKRGIDITLAYKEIPPE